MSGFSVGDLVLVWPHNEEGRIISRVGKSAVDDTIMWSVEITRNRAVYCLSERHFRLARTYTLDELLSS